MNTLIVALVGDTGRLGTLIGNALLDKPNVEHRLLVRPASRDKVTALAQRGAQIVEGALGDVPASLFAGASSVVSALQGGPDVIIDGQAQLFRAAREAAVRRFVPRSIWACDSGRPDIFKLVPRRWPAATTAAMRLVKPPPSLAPYGLRAMTMVARAADGGLVDTHRTPLATAQRIVLGTDLDVDALPEIDAATLAEHVADPEVARQLVRGMIVMRLAVGPATEAQMKLIADFARALRVEEPAIRAIEHLAREEMVRFIVDLHRRSNLREYIDNQVRAQGGIFGVVKGLLEFKGVVHEPALAARFRALGDLPDGTLGRAFFAYYRVHGFAFPGEKGGFPVGAMFHDFGHVLSGYDTTPEGEMQVACFQAGYRKTENAFFTILFAVLVHSAGIHVAPLPMPKHPGRIGEGDLAERMIHALERGAQVTLDLGDRWDFWPWVELPLAEARRRINVPPPAERFRTGVGVYGPPIGTW